MENNNDNSDGFEIDKLFDRLINPDVKDCDIEDIDPSKPGWEIFLHFEGVDPRIPGTPAHEDYKTFKYLQNFCLAKVEYKEGTRTMSLSHLEGCCDDQFAPEHVTLMEKYSPTAKAPESCLKPQAKTLPPPPISAKVRDSAAEILASAAALKETPPVIREVNSIIAPEEVPDDIVITLSLAPEDAEELEDTLDKIMCIDLNDLIKKLQDIADEEELLFEHGAVEDSTIYIINIYKNPKIKYRKPMDPKNMAVILQLPFEKI